MFPEAEEALPTDCNTNIVYPVRVSARDVKQCSLSYFSIANKKENVKDYLYFCAKPVISF